MKVLVIFINYSKSPSCNFIHNTIEKPRKRILSSLELKCAICIQLIVVAKADIKCGFAI